MTLIYLDTNHVSDLVRDRGADSVETMRELLLSGELRLGISLAHLIELSDPDFASRDDVGQFLDDCSLRWATLPPDLFDQEIRAAYVQALLGQSPTVQAFFRSFRNAYEVPRHIDTPPNPEILEIVASLDEFRDSVKETTRQAANLDRHLKKNAAVYDNPTEPLEAMIRDRGIGVGRSPGGLHLPAVYPPHKVIDRAGGLDGFPAYYVWHQLHYDRLGDEQFPVEPNDILDEIHACYLPYVDALAVDRRTLGRLRNTNLESVDRAARTLEDTLDIITNKNP